MNINITHMQRSTYDTRTNSACVDVEVKNHEWSSEDANQVRMPRELMG